MSRLDDQAELLRRQVLALAEEATSDGYNDAEACILEALRCVQSETIEWAARYLESIDAPTLANALRDSADRLCDKDR